MHCRIRLQIRRMLEVLCLLYHHLHRLIFMIQTQQKSGRSLSKLGRIILLDCHEVASGTRSHTSCNIPFCMSELKCRKFSLCLQIGRVTPTKTRFSLCYKSLQCTIGHLKMCLLKDISFILECKNRESLTITIRKLFDS